MRKGAKRCRSCPGNAGMICDRVRIVTGTNCPGTKCRGYELSRVRIVMGTNCRGYELSRVRIVAGTNCPGMNYRGYELSRVRTVAGTN